MTSPWDIIITARQLYPQGKNAVIDRLIDELERVREELASAIAKDSLSELRAAYQVEENIATEHGQAAGGIDVRSGLEALADRLNGAGHQGEEAVEMNCNCHRCLDERDERADNGMRIRMTMFVVCKSCGNKRCPHATDHDLACTGSNEPGQTGSIYA